jgi:uroporphyrinogen III methyltransferase/synthase
MAGKVSFVGAGTGDPRLLTLRAAEVLAEADYVLFDPTIHPDVLGRLPEGTPRHPVTEQLSPQQIALLLSGEAKAGRHAVRLTWGDPLFFGRADVEAAAVARHDVPLELVPGIGPLIAVGAFAGVPLTRTSDASPSVAAVTVTRGHETLHDWEKLATATDTLAIVCDAESVVETARSLVFYGRKPAEPATLVENVSLPNQRVKETTLGEIPLLPPPSAPRVVLVVGERATPAPELAWFGDLPLFGKRVLVTRAREQASQTASLLRDRGADPVVVPTIEIHSPANAEHVAEAVSDLGRYGWIVLTSANGVDRLWEEVRRQGKDARAFAGAKIAAIGPGTAAALEPYGLTPDLVPKTFKGEGLAEELVLAIGAAEKKPRVLVARAEVARDVVPEALREAGCEVDVVAVYKTKAPPQPFLDALASLLEGKEIDVVTFTSSSTVTHLCDALEGRAAALLARTCVASIGPITTETARKRGLRVDVTASEHTIRGLVEAIEAHFDLATTGTRSIARL